MKIISSIWIGQEDFSMRDGAMRRCIVLHWGSLRIRGRSIGIPSSSFVSYSQEHLLTSDAGSGI